MPDTRPDEPRDFTDLPIQPTGSGVADTEIAMMQAAVAPDDDADADDDRATRRDDGADAPARTQG